MTNFLPHTDISRTQILEELGLNNIEALFDYMDKGIRLHESLNLPEGLSELEVRQKLHNLATKNKTATEFNCFLGGGCYNKFTPACIANLTQRSEFITAYTPYQPEISQGTLQAIYEYQTMICNLTGLDVSNAGVYDGATACAEAVLMACRIKKKNKALVASTLNPDYKRVMETYANALDIEIDYMPNKNGSIDIQRLESIEERDDYACILIQTPNYFGCLEDGEKFAEIAKYFKSLLIVCADPSTLSVLEAPAAYGADIVVGDIQSLGIPMSFGGPHAGYMACKTEYMRQIPGRIVGKSIDRRGNSAFCLTLQAREQHIRREKATSNICSNQALMCLWATIYMSVMGLNGMKEATLISIQRAHYLAQKISEIKGFKVLFNNYLSEFVLKIELPISADEFLNYLAEKSIFGGIKLSEDFENLNNAILVSSTEMTTIDDIYLYITTIKELSNSLLTKDQNND